MPFRYRLQKILEARIREKDKQLQNVRNAQALVLKIEGLIERNNKEIAQTLFMGLVSDSNRFLFE